MKIATHQINTVTGDIEGNYAKIIDKINNNPEVDIHVFPETAISGYCCGALWDNIDFVNDQQSKIDLLKEYIRKDQAIIIGYVHCDRINEDGFPNLYNSVAIINNNKIRRYDKQLLASSDHHEDKKYFNAGKKSKVFELKLKDFYITVGVPICEDAWFTHHDRNIPQEMVMLGAQLIIVPNQSYFYYGKNQIRKDLFSAIAKDNKVPVINVNAIGVGDIVKNIMIFDGGSMAFNCYGELVGLSNNFTEDTGVINWKALNRKLSIEEFEYFENEFLFPSKYNEIIDALIFEQKEFFRLCGISKAQVHMSGGIDSAVVASIVTLAMGKENVVLISQPSSLNTKSKEYAQHISDSLGIKLWWEPIEEIYQKIKEVDSLVFDQSGQDITKTGLASFQAVLRTVLGLGATHRFKSGIVSTGNLTENCLSWFSYKDIGSTGVHQPLGDLTKLEIYELAQHLNTIFHKEAIPVVLFDEKFKPAAELPDAMEDPIDYWIQSGICAELIRHRKNKETLLQEYDNITLSSDSFPDRTKVYKYSREEFQKQIEWAQGKLKVSVYKCAQSAPVVICSPRSRGFSNRETLINKYNYK